MASSWTLIRYITCRRLLFRGMVWKASSSKRSSVWLAVEKILMLEELAESQQ